MSELAIDSRPTVTSRWRVLAVGMAILAVIAPGCHQATNLNHGGLAPQTDVGRREIAGIVDWGVPTRETKATVSDVAVAATVSLIDPTLAETVATSKTTPAGAFLLTFPSWTPVVGQAYILEAVKGLQNHAVGKYAARVRTLLTFSSGIWSAISIGIVTLNARTTALSIIDGTRSDVAPATLIDKLILGLADSSVLPTTPDTFTPGSLPITQADFHNVSNLVDQALLGDLDPIAYINGSSGSYTLQAPVGSSPVVNQFFPNSGGFGATVTLVGTNFNDVQTNNTVKFNGVIAPIVSSSSTSLVVTVPTTTTGILTVSTPTGTSNAGVFTIIPQLAGQFPAD